MKLNRFEDKIHEKVENINAVIYNLTKQAGAKGQKKKPSKEGFTAHTVRLHKQRFEKSFYLNS